MDSEISEGCDGPTKKPYKSIQRQRQSTVNININGDDSDSNRNSKSTNSSVTKIQYLSISHHIKNEMIISLKGERISITYHIRG